MTHLITDASGVSEGSGSTSWTVPAELDDNTKYFWRVRATDGTAFSLWTYGTFFVNTKNDSPPGGFGISHPADGFEVTVMTPELEIAGSIDPDNDSLFYVFNVYNNSSMTNLIATSPLIPENKTGKVTWKVESALSENTNYYWKAVATDEHGLQTETPGALFIINTQNASPETPVISSPLNGADVTDGRSA